MPLCGSIPFQLSIPSSLDLYVVSIPWLLCTWELRYLLKIPLSNSATFTKAGIGEMYLNVVKATMTNPQQTKQSSEKLKAFSLKLERRQGSPLSPLLVNIVLEVLIRAINQDKNHLSQEVVKLLFADSIILYIKNSKDPTKNLSDRNEFSKVSGSKNKTTQNQQKQLQLHFYV